MSAKTKPSPLWSAAHRKKSSEALKGNKNSLGRIFSEEHRRRISENRKGIGLGRKLSITTRRRISLAATGKHYRNGMYGKKHTNETKALMSRVFKERHHTKATKRKIRLAMLNNTNHSNLN